MDLTSHDSGNVTCVAMVTTPEGVSHVDQTTSQLSVLGEWITICAIIWELIEGVFQERAREVSQLKPYM